MASTFVRLKRKRCEEPTESLLVACKREKISEDAAISEEDSSTSGLCKGVFKLAGTVESKDGSQLKKAIDVYNSLNTIPTLRTNASISSESSAAASQTQQNLFRIDQSDLNEKQEELRRLFPQSSTTNRANDLEASTKLLEEVVSVAANISSQKKSPSSTSAASADMVVYDAILNPDKKVSLISGGLPESEDVLCNGELMTRTVNESAAASMDTEDDYVYDIFCLDQKASDLGDIGEIFTIEAYGENFGPFAEYRSDQLYEDEDDSNDEDNWRNDYPDEMDSCSSEEGDDLLTTGLGRGGNVYGGDFNGLTLASSEDSTSGEDEFGLPDYKTENADFAHYYKSYKSFHRRAKNGDDSSSNEEEAYSDSYDDLLT